MKLIKNISEDNFLFGGLVYHHKEITDPEERDKQFQKKIDVLDGKEVKSIEDIEVGIENIYSLMASLRNIQKSQSLSQLAMNKTMQYFGNDAEPYPIDTIYENKNHDNTWIDNGIKIINSDIIIFISMKGIVGSIYSKDSEKQRMGILYEYDEDLGVNFGKVIDLKIYEDFLEYDKYVGDLI